jgi:DHA1 family bicyclomycin/chloramphenicol resistance-like MFS transporter
MAGPTNDKIPPGAARDTSQGGMSFPEFVGMIAAMMAMAALAIDTMLPALPAIASSLGVTDENKRQLIITAFLLGFGGAQLFYGPISDRFGRRPILLLGLIGYVLFSAGVVLAPNFTTLLLFRGLQGVSVAATRVVTISVVRDCYGGRQMARVMSLAFMVFLAVPVLAPSIGQFFLLFLPWRGLFWVLAGYGLIVLTWIVIRLPETLHPEYRRSIDFPSVFLAVRRTLTTRQSVGYMLAQLMLQSALYGFINSVQQIFADSFQAAWLMPGVFAGIAGMMALASLVNSRIVEQIGTRRVSHTALLGFVLVEFAHLVITVSGHETLVTFSLSQGAAMFCFGLSMPNFGAMAMEPMAKIAGTAASVQGFTSTVGGAILGFGIGQSFDGTSLPMTAGFAAAGVLALVIILVTEGGRLFGPPMGASRHQEPLRM